MQYASGVERASPRSGTRSRGRSCLARISPNSVATTERGADTARENDRMRPVKEHEVGLMFWGTGNPEQDLARVFDFGLSAGQLGFPGELPLQDTADRWASALAKNPEF